MSTYDENCKCVVEIQNVIETYGRAWDLKKSRELNPDIARGVNAHILVIPCTEDCNNGFKMRIRCGGTLIQHKEVYGTYVPLMLKNIMQPQESSDHIGGCSKLNNSTNPEVVNRFIKGFDRIINKVYVDPIEIKFDTSRIDEAREGLIPVIVTGRPYAISDSEYKSDADCKIYGYLCMGNCS